MTPEQPQTDTPPDLRIARLAREQNGMVSSVQLRACGIASGGITVRVRNGRLHRMHRGVYAVGHDAPTLRGRFQAAILACGEGAVLSHYSAAVLWGLARLDDRHLEVTIAGSSARSIDGVRVHRSRQLDRRDVTRRHGIALTSVPRTLLDLGAVLPQRALRRLVRQAQAEQLVSIPQLLELLSRANGHRGAPALRATIGGGPAPTLSELEDVILDLLDGAGIERPMINSELFLDGRRIVPDLLWTDLKLVIEADGSAWHDNKLAREDDAERQALLEAHGYRVLRITWEQVVRQPQQTLARIRAARGE